MRSGVICRISLAVGPLPSDRVVWQAKQVPWNVAQPLSVPGNPRPGPAPPPCAAGGGACGAGGAAGACAPSHAVQTKTATAATALIKDEFFMVCILIVAFALRVYACQLRLHIRRFMNDWRLLPG